MAHHTPLTGTLRRLRRGRSLVGCAIDSERLEDIVHGRVLPNVDELGRIARTLGLTHWEAQELRDARRRTHLVQVHRSGLPHAS